MSTTKFIKREPNSTILATNTNLWLDYDSAKVLDTYAEFLKVPKEYIIEYLLEVLIVSKISVNELEDFQKLQGYLCMCRNESNNTSYKFVKVEDGKNLPK